MKTGFSGDVGKIRFEGPQSDKALAAVDLYGVLPYAVRATHGRLSLRLPSSERTGWQA